MPTDPVSTPPEDPFAKGATMIRELPVTERPRERLLSHGSHTLSDAELLAVLLRTGRPGVSALEMGRQLLAEWGSLQGLQEARFSTLRREGLGKAKLSTLLAALELGRRLARAQLPERRLMSHPAEVAQYLSLRYCTLAQEVMGALFVDTRNRLIGEQEIFRGTLNRAAVEPRLLLKECLIRDAAGILLFHTHPSGDPTPSAEDLAFTRRMAQASDLVGVYLVDHLVLGGMGRWVSMRRRGGW